MVGGVVGGTYSMHPLFAQRLRVAREEVAQIQWYLGIGGGRWYAYDLAFPTARELIEPTQSDREPNG